MNKIGISSNVMKIIAIFAIIFDHVAVYFEDSLPEEIYVIFRIIGRIAMPIFAYLIVQGFFHTKNIVNYVKRLLVAGVITQFILFILYTVNSFVFIDYTITKDILKINILISFAISLIIMKTIDECIKCIKEKKRPDKVLTLLTIVSVILISTYIFAEYDYSYALIVYLILIYAVEKIKIEKKISNGIYYIFQFLAILIFVIIYNSIIEYFCIFSLLLIMLYSGKQGKKNKIIKMAFYIMYPLQHFILYLLAMAI